MRSTVDREEWRAFGEWVETLRRRAGLPVNELARQATVSAMWLQEIRGGGRTVYGEWRLPNPKDEALARLARALDVPVDEMLARAGRSLGESITEQPPSPDDRIRELEERVAEHQREIAELRRRLEEERDGRADAR
jgi:transcriptional regulator with XRE-family HTH domain